MRKLSFLALTLAVMSGPALAGDAAKEISTAATHAEMAGAAGDAQNNAIDEDGDQADPEAGIVERRPNGRYSFAQFLDVTVFAIGADEGTAEAGELVGWNWPAALRTVANVRVDAGGHRMSLGLL